MEYNAIIREYSGRSLKVLGNVLLADFDDVPHQWTIRYNSQDIDRSKISLRDLCCNPLNPIQLYKPCSSGFDVWVNTIDGEQFKVFLGESDSVSILKLKIFQLLPNYPPHVQTLRIGTIFESAKKLDDSFPILQLNISSAYLVYLKPCFKKLAVLNKGLGLHDMYGITVMEAMSASPSPWKEITKGLNFVGTCENPNCKTKTLKVGNQEVSVAPKQYGNFQINFVQGTSLKCPACSSDAETDILMNIDDNMDMDTSKNLFQITPTKLVLKSARATIYYKTSDSGKVSKVTREYTVGGATWERGFKIFSHLEINCVEPWRSPYSCVKCDTKILYKIHENVLGCGHAYHDWCAPSVLKRSPCKVCCSKKIFVNGKLNEVLCGM